MSKVANLLKIFGVIAVVVAVGIALGWLAGRTTQGGAPVSPPPVPRAADPEPATPTTGSSASNNTPRPLVAQPGARVARPNSLKLPALLEVARDPDHPNATPALDILEMFLDDDYGTDWNIWQVKVEQWLKNNPN